MYPAPAFDNGQPPVVYRQVAVDESCMVQTWKGEWTNARSHANALHDAYPDDARVASYHAAVHSSYTTLFGSDARPRRASTSATDS